jgi:uncharacterized protein (DUF488 family)
LYTPSLSAIATIFTIGHSKHELGDFLELLHGQEIGRLADVRRYPSSRRMPWFNRPVLARSLDEAGVAYEHFEALGGRRAPLPGSPNGGWRVGQFQGYADHMASDEFQAGLERLLAGATERRAAVMCAEAQWVKCHRRLLSDVLVARGHEVLHIDARGATSPHELTEFALVDGERVTYPPLQPQLGEV